ncbi:hypothetical protein NDA11_004192 [Ustilago hordei]|uniref:Uncharacterized protein n=1 Tax=Ustilago hordei TaxID=120017 RepID=I2FQE6_USTHO|nr:uncharacterized protein UHO2_06320 [Ustilago hordei]KAJ1038454.1 hypothetical protein NDA10_005680 [Ustilago hordei]KAJ1570378.1 hypothetical protein NDA15_003862 [Ustilago hordei]KAJ1571833.1 hypothetical protein NDA12_004952 [Ustilago hordei]KAJ1575958.1 hypothetical protein NDA11_004192 [Ustilago hordei]KAJ1604215.1 hypothetical protein NDA14_005856 [Ustilago hordei]
MNADKAEDEDGDEVEVKGEGEGEGEGEDEGGSCNARTPVGGDKTHRKRFCRASVEEWFVWAEVCALRSSNFSLGSRRFEQERAANRRVSLPSSISRCNGSVIG